MKTYAKKFTTKADRQASRSAAMLANFQNPEWRRKWEINNAVGKAKRKLMREQANTAAAKALAAVRAAFVATLTPEERRLLGYEQ